MIIAIAGPDGVGKTTLWTNLRRIVHDAVFIPSFPMDEKLLPVADLVAARNAAVWEAVYDPKKLYVVDRFFVVDSYAYALRYNRDSGAPRRYMDRWRDEIRCLYLAHERPFRSDPVEKDHEAALRSYMQTMLFLEFRYMVFDDPIHAAFFAAEHIRSWRSCLERSWTE